MIVRFFKGGFGVCLAIPASCLLTLSCVAYVIAAVLKYVAMAVWDKAFALLEVDDD